MIAQPKWQKSESVTQVEKSLFHATQTANFPTTETLDKGGWMYEISHRFSTPIKEGENSLWGFDGPARIRFALAYGITDDLMVTLGRSNITDNYDLQFKQKLFHLANSYIPSEVSIVGGLALNSEVPQTLDRDKFDSDNLQLYAQLIYNTILLDDKLAIGLVPSFLYNSFIYAVDKQYSFTFGSYIQYYFNRTWSLWIEHNAIITGYQGKIRLDETKKSFNSLVFGATLETGGHIFNIIVSNNARLNPSQFLVGANDSAGENMWRFGFSIIRYF